MIELVNVTKNYGKTIALKNVSFKIESDSITGLIGENGAGKSTIIKLITSQIAPTEGQVFVGGIDATENPLEAKKLIGYVSENPRFYDNMTVKKFILHCFEIFNIEKNNLEKTLSEFSLEEVAEKKISALSKGYRQRLALAQSIMHNPKILVLDEPSTGLDPSQMRELRQMILKHKKNRIILFSTHIMSEVESLCSNIILLDHGKIIETGSTQEILQKYNCENLEAAFIKISGKNNL